MSGPIKDADLSFLKGCELIQICVGRHELILNFFDRVTITVFSEIVHYDEFNRKNNYQNFSTAPVTLANLFAAPILDTEISQDGALRLKFEMNNIIEFISDSNLVESYTIQHNDKFIVV